MNRLGILRSGLLLVIGLVAGCGAPPPDDTGRQEQAIHWGVYCATSCDCARGSYCDGNHRCQSVDFSPPRECFSSCHCDYGYVCTEGGNCCVANHGSSCTWIGGPYEGCSQYMSVWCTAPGQSLYAMAYMGPAPGFCGAGNSLYDVYCNQPGTIQCDGSCQ